MADLDINKIRNAVAVKEAEEAAAASTAAAARLKFAEELQARIELQKAHTVMARNALYLMNLEKMVNVVGNIDFAKVANRMAGEQGQPATDKLYLNTGISSNVDHKNFGTFGVGRRIALVDNGRLTNQFDHRYDDAYVDGIDHDTYRKHSEQLLSDVSGDIKPDGLNVTPIIVYTGSHRDNTDRILYGICVSLDEQRSFAPSPGASEPIRDYQKQDFRKIELKMVDGTPRIVGRTYPEAPVPVKPATKRQGLLARLGWGSNK